MSVRFINQWKGQRGDFSFINLEFSKFSLPVPESNIHCILFGLGITIWL